MVQLMICAFDPLAFWRIAVCQRKVIASYHLSKEPDLAESRGSSADADESGPTGWAEDASTEQ